MGGIAAGLLPIRPLAPTDTLEGFDSGNDQLNHWLLQRAQRSMRESTARVYVLFNTAGTLCGFYALSMHAVARAANVPGSLRRNSPDPIPCTLLGQPAVDQRMQGQQIGARLLQDAVKRAMAASQTVASRALVVGAVNDSAAEFYRHFGFQDLDDAGRLFLKL